MLAAWTSTTTSPGPATGSGASPRRSTSGPPCFVSNAAFIVSSCLLLRSQKLDQQFAHPRRLLLLYPMARTFEQMTAQHTSTHALLHALEITGTLIGPPIALASDKHRRDIDRPAGK